MRTISSLVLLLCCLLSTSATAKVLPVDYFANLPDVSSVALSKDGKKLSSIIRFDVDKTKGTAIQVTNLETGKNKIVLFSDNSKYFIGAAYWKDDVSLLVHTWYPAERDTWVGFTQVRGETRERRLLIINTESEEVTSPFKKTFLKRYSVLPSGLDQIVDRLPEDPDHILMSVPSINRGFPSYPTVKKINIKNQRIKSVKSPKTSVYGWGTDQQHRVRTAYRQDDETFYNRVHDINTGKWLEIWPHEIFSGDEVNILGFDYDPNIVYITAYHNGYKAVFKVDLRDKERKRELVFANPDYDVSGYLIYGRKSQRVIGVGSEAEEGTQFIAPDFIKLQQGIDKALAGKRNFIYSITDDENKFIIYSTGPTESGTYYLGTRSPMKLKALAYRYKNLPPEVLSSVEKITYKARDGLEIEGYLTLPKGSNGKNLPTLMFPHGGPIARDSNAFDYWAQFYANRGYAVLQMNFRGSAGQGLEFQNSGLKKWGKEMQDDIEDGALELIKRGITDPDRICIVGASYGGYAALMGVVKTPDRYKCAISVNGVSNVRKLVLDNRRFWASYNVVDEMIGTNAKELKQISPVNYAEKIKAPVLLIHGELDRQVEIEHSYQMRDALKQANKNVTFIEQAGEDHYLSNEKMRVQAFQAMADFLEKHLPANQKVASSSAVE
ncbi:Dipeptidyl aminopeptidase/acylaminoacyl peptidase [Alteromonadaceae bacterium Bs31]|nr:Dipeptidyl aminopeptidase/acylaminoacyl peptidase [Alteromonadaceae bacterium Bs31]